MDQAEATDAIQTEATEETQVEEGFESQKFVQPEESDDSEPEVTDELEGEEGEESEEIEDLEEVEYDGEKYKLPKNLKEALLRQEDYTRKTQEVAQNREALEAEVAQFQQAAQMQQANLQGYAQLSAINSQLEQYNGVDWTAFSQNDPQAAQQAFFQYSQLKDAATNLGTTLQQQEAQSLQQQHEMRARQLEQGRAELARDIQGYGEETRAALLDHGETEGFSKSELKAVMDPRMIRVLHKAMLYDKSLKSATKPAEKTVATPAKKVKGKAPVNRNPDKMSSDEWLKWRNKQLASK